MSTDYSDKDLAIVACLGNIFEWYEFSVYSYLAPIFALQFFSSGNIKLNIIKAFGVFTISYFARPLGSLFFGYVGDRYGSAKTYRISLLMMSIGAVCVGLLPTYHTFGELATLLLILVRLVQGFSAGGELPGSLVFIFNHVAQGKRRFFCSLISGSTLLGVLFASLMVSFLHHLMSEDAVIAWGWRLPFLLSIIIFPILQSLVFKRLKRAKTVDDQGQGFLQHIGQLFRHHFKPLSQVIGLNAYVATVFYLVYFWMPSYLSIYLHVPSSTANLLVSGNLLLLIIFTLSISFFSKKIGYRQLMFASAISMLLLALPLFLLIARGQLYGIIFSLISFTVLLSLLNSVFMVTLPNLFPSGVRTLGVSLGYTISASIFGGLTPTFCSWLMYHFDTLYSPSFLLMAVSLIVLPVIYSLEGSMLGNPTKKC